MVKELNKTKPVPSQNILSWVAKATMKFNSSCVYILWLVKKYGNNIQLMTFTMSKAIWYWSQSLSLYDLRLMINALRLN